MHFDVRLLQRVPCAFLPLARIARLRPSRFRLTVPNPSRRRGCLSHADVASPSSPRSCRPSRNWYDDRVGVRRRRLERAAPAPPLRARAHRPPPARSFYSTEAGRSHFRNQLQSIRCALPFRPAPPPPAPRRSRLTVLPLVVRRLRPGGAL